MSRVPDDGGDQILVDLQGVAIGYGGRALVRSVSLQVRAGELWGIVGPNGAGKSTLVKTILGLIRPVAGDVAFPSGQPRFGYVPQRHGLNPNYPLTAFDVALMGRTDRLGLGRRPGAADRQRAAEELDRVGLGAEVRTPYASLSGGQQQKVLMARALASDPDVLVLDEPTTGMDLPAESDMLAFLRRLHATSGITMLMIGHHIVQIAGLVGHICLINKDTDLFDAGPAEQMLVEEHLGQAYRRPIRVARHGARISVDVMDEGPRD